MKFSDLPQAPSGGSYGGWIMHVPVINRRHLPPAEVGIIQRLQPGRCGTFEDPPLLAHIFNGKGHLFFVTDIDAGDLPHLPVLERLLLRVREKGYEECRLDIDGMEFEDLELFLEETSWPQVLNSPGAVVGYRGDVYQYRADKETGQLKVSPPIPIVQNCLVRQEDGTCKWMSAAEMEAEWPKLYLKQPAKESPDEPSNHPTT